MGLLLFIPPNLNYFSDSGSGPVPGGFSSFSASLAAAIKIKDQIKGKKVALIASGGNITLSQLEFAISKCSTFISCHGAPTHIAAAFNKKIIDIIDISEKNFFDKWSAHFRKYKQLHRSEFSKLSEDVLNNI